MASGEGGNVVVGADVAFWYPVGLTFLRLQEASAFFAILRNESMSRAGLGMKETRTLLLLGVCLLALPSGTAAQTCTTGSKAVALFAGIHHSCALLVSKRSPLG